MDNFNASKITDLFTINELNTNVESSDLITPSSEKNHLFLSLNPVKIKLESWETLQNKAFVENKNLCIKEAITLVHDELTGLLNDPKLDNRMNLAFGDRFNYEIANDIFQKFAQNDFSDLPSIEIITSNDLNSANGAFASANETIYLSSEFLTANIENQQAISDVLLEEIGHYLDSQINIADAPGDEGAVFQRVISDEQIEASELEALKTEDDHTTVILNDRLIEIEQSLELPIISISATDSSAAETIAGQTKDRGKFTISRTGSTASALTVRYTIDGSATNSSDYKNITNSSVNIPAGLSRVIVPVDVIDDRVLESTETVSITLAANSNYGLGTKTIASVAIADNEKPNVSISVIDAEAAETVSGEINNFGKILIRRNGSTSNPLTVNYTLSGTATNGIDYSNLTGSVVIPVGESGIYRHINIVDDAFYEENEIVNVNLSASNNYTLNTTKIATIAIADNDPVPKITVTSPNGGESLQAGSSYNLAWNDNISENVKIDLYKGGSFERTVLNSTASDGNETWTVPANLVFGADYSLKISSVNNNNIADLSNNNFTIQSADLKKFWFYYNYKDGEYTKTDSYVGSVIAPTGKYTIGTFNFKSGNNEAGLNGTYNIYQVEEYDDSLINEAGRVFVNKYWDRDNGAVQEFIPYQYRNGIQPAGINYLGSEVDYIGDNGSPQGKFGQDYDEADLPGNPIHLGLVDFNKDGQQDILWRNLANSALHAWQMDGFTPVKDLDIVDEPDSAWHPAALADFNNDGNVDIVSRYYGKDNTGHNRIWLMDGNNRIGSVDLLRVPDGNWHISGTGDFNQDGNVDLLWRHYPSGENHVWFMNGTNQIGGAVLQTETNPNLQIAGTADFNKDGKIDILWRNYATGANSIWLMDGTNRSSIVDLPTVGDLNWRIVGTGDFNKDGNADLLWRHTTQGSITTWLMNGTTRTDGKDIGNIDNNWSIVGDSDPIPVWTAEYFNNASLSGTPVSTQAVGNAYFTNSVAGLSLNWSTSAPPNTPADNFSARFKTNRYLAPGLYKINSSADDGMRVKIGDQWVVSKYDQIGNFTGYFRSNGGYYPIAVEYKEIAGGASLNLEIAPAQKFQDNVPGGQWNARVYHWNGQGSTPPVDFYNDETNYIGTINLGSNVRSDGKWGVNAQNWGQGAPNGDNNRLPHDWFIMRAYSQYNFEAGKTYKATIRSDDGYQLFAKNHATGQFHYFTSQNEWRSDAYGSKEVTFTVPQSGGYDLHFQMFEGGGDAYFDLKVEDVTAPPPPSSVWDRPLTSYSISRGFTGSDHTLNQHRGIDLAAATGTRVEAAKNGVVSFVGWYPTNQDNGGYGLYVKVNHGNGVETRYCHLSQASVSVGQTVDINTKIGEVGSTGYSTGPHLHFEVVVNGTAQNPTNYIQF